MPAGVNTESVCILTYINKAVSVIGSEPDGWFAGGAVFSGSTGSTAEHSRAAH